MRPGRRSAARTWAICPRGSERAPGEGTHRATCPMSEAIFRTRPRRSCAKIEFDVGASLADLRGYSGRPNAGVSTPPQFGTWQQYAFIGLSTE